MSKLDEILVKRAIVDKESRVLAKGELKALFLELVGEDETLTRTNAHIDIEREGKNEFRATLRKSIEEL